ncbi:MAG: sulfide/dihydroorotate dehydrogenase-like FAD/NAD-binding protein [Coriobacteriia bacterium]|nr:sulfide/dihydroorotate dehydrogenase-like FAD/NAD-binding protein [Coriobacteriia bacterium]
MYPIIEIEDLNPEVVRLVVEAPAIARKHQPGQFIILRIDETGERIPLTVNEVDPEAGTVTVVFQKVGATTMQLAALRPGDALQDLVGPLGKPTDFGNAKRVAVIGGGLGCAIAYPEAKELHDKGIAVDLIAGFRTANLIFMGEKLQAACDSLIIVTDDGSNGHRGFVTDALRERLNAGIRYDLVIAIGPVVMMDFVCRLTKEYGIRTLVSMNTVMIDGTGMCGCCRVKVNGEYKHACIDGPDFEGHEVDFTSVMERSVQFRQYETQALNNYRRQHPEATMRRS